MISNINANNTAILQNTQDLQEKKGTSQVKENKALSKVESIKEQIKSGTYKIDIQKTAQSVFEELI